jgi:membrane-associated phospholipid phosphatase
VCLFSKHIPEQILKHASYALNLSVGKRPNEAKNCNSINSGGIATSPGLISGHVLNLTSVISYLVYDANGFFTVKRLSLIGFLLVFDLFLIYSRVLLKCHTHFQVVFGFVFGLIWGYVIYVTIHYLESKYHRIKTDHQKLKDLL